MAESNTSSLSAMKPKGTDPLSLGAATVLWLACLVMLVSTPFFIENHHLPSVFSPAYAFIALGMLAGVICAKAVAGRMPLKRKLVLGKVALFACAALTAVLVVPEWYFHLRAFAGSALSMEEIAPYMPLMVTFADVATAPFGQITGLHHALLFVSGLCYAIAAGTLFSAPRNEGDRVCLPNHELQNKASGQEKTGQKQKLPLIAGAFACGLLHPGVWGWLAHTYGTNWKDSVMHDLLGFMGATIFGLAIGVGFAFVLYWANKKLGVRACAMLASLALGEIAWNLIARCGNAIENIILVAPVASVSLASLELFLICLVFKPWPATKANEDVLGSMANRESSSRQNELFAKCGLTDRETQAAKLALQGMSSNEAAETIGVKASTVRTYLHRAYQKLKVENLDELRKLCGIEPAPEEQAAQQAKEASLDVLANKQPALDGQTSPKVSQAVSGKLKLGQVLLVLVAGMLLLPHQYVGTVASWNSSHSAIIGCGLGLMTAAGLLCLMQQKSAKVKLSRKAGALCLVALLFSGLAFAGAQYAFAHEIQFASQSVQLFLIGIAGMVFAFCFGLSTSIESHRPKLRPTAAGATCVIALALLPISYLNDLTWLLLSVLSLAAYICFKVFSLVKCEMQATAETDTTRLPMPDTCLFVVAALPFGVIAGELWRGLQNPLLLAIYLVFLIASIAFFAYRQKGSATPKVTAVFCLAILASLAIAAGLPHALLILCALAFFGVNRPASAKAFIILGIGAGFAFGRLGFDTWRDLLGASFTTTESFGTNVAAAAVAPAIIAIAAVLSLACIFYLTSLYTHNNTACYDASKEERDILFLRSRGINELEAAILAKIAQGSTGPQIARSMHYSPGAVNSLRAHAYRALNVHSKQELMELLSQNHQA